MHRFWTGLKWGVVATIAMSALMILGMVSGKHNPGERRSIQDWDIRYQLAAVPGVSALATLGGFEKH